MVGLGFIACIVPGVYLLVTFAVVIPVLMTEDQRGFKALGRSRALVGGYWWRTLGVLALGGILTAIISGALNGLLLAFISRGASPTTWIISNAATTTISRLITTPFTAAFVTILYFDLRVRKEGFDLKLLANRLGVDPPEGWVPEPDAPPANDGAPPFWPPPPGWTPPAGTSWPSAPGPAAERPAAPPSAGGTAPPFWPPPPGWAPSGADE